MLKRDAPNGPPCRGVLGRLFGHKFKMGMGESVFLLEFCKRCGWRP